MKEFVVFLLLPAVFAISGCVVVPVAETGQPYQEPYQQSYQQPAAEEETVEVPVVYGEPVYYPPPIVVRYTYDYYTYENVGGYVNIVFWRNGHRFHNEPWYDHGRRMRIEHMHEWQHDHRIRAREFEHHRERLEHVHHIAHPDSYYGRRPGGPGRQEKGHDRERVNPPRRDNTGRVISQPRQPGQQQQPPEKGHDRERVNSPRRDNTGRVISQPRQPGQQQQPPEKGHDRERVNSPRRDNAGRAISQPRQPGQQQKPQTQQGSGQQPKPQKRQSPEREQKKHPDDKHIN
jgi:hypothetical protein